jgi:hypothetical protein
MQWNFHDNARARATAPRRSRSEVRELDSGTHGFEAQPGSDFLEADGKDPSAEALERGLHREERRHAERRKAIGVTMALAVAGAVLLGGGFAALAAAHSPSPQVAMSAATAPVHPAKSKKRKAKTKRSAKAAAAARRARKTASANSAK